MRATIFLMPNMRCAISAAITLRLSPSVTATKPSALSALGAAQHVVIDAGADLDSAGEAAAEPFECGRIFVDDDHVVRFGCQAAWRASSRRGRSRR